MVSDAEKYKGDDEKMKLRIEAKNSFENHCFQMRNTLNDEKLREKFTEEDKKTIEDLSKEGLKWLEENPMAEPADIEAEQKKIEGRFYPIMTRIYQATGGQEGAATGAEGMSRGGAEQFGAGGAGPQQAAADDLD